MIKGTIALDIDGTLTADSKSHALPQNVVECLTKLASDGWLLVFITGRSFQGSFRILKDLPFNYFLAVQNGALIVEMPNKKILSKKYLERTIVSKMEEICRDLPSDFAVYSGFENNDVVFFRPHCFSKELREYLKARTLDFHETWNPLESFEQLAIHAFPSVKCFGLFDTASEAASRIESRLGLHVPLIKDPFDERYYVVQATHSGISKGQALVDLLRVLEKEGIVIAAGDDLNDLPMLKEADIKIAMRNAPQELLAIADIIPPPSSEFGIIQALEEATKEGSRTRIPLSGDV